MEARVIAGVIVLVGVSLGAVVVTTRAVVTRIAVTRAATELDNARAAFYRLVENRTEFAAAQTRLITSLPVFRATMTDIRLASDYATLHAMADDYRDKLGAQFCIVTDPTGKRTATPGWPEGIAFSPGLEANIHEAVGGRSTRDIVSIQGRLFLVVSEPARFAEESLGTMSFGFALDDSVAKELATITNCEISLVSTERISGSSLPQPEQTALASLLTAGDLLSADPTASGVRSVGNKQYFSGAFSLFSDRPSDMLGRLVLLQDYAPTQQFLNRLRNSLLLTGSAAFVFALAAGLIFSRRTSRPLMDIAAAAGEIASGDWSVHVPVHGSAEATTLATAFNDMTASLRGYSEEVRDKSERLQAAYERFSSVTQSARDAILSTNDNGVITFWSRSAETIFGFAETDILGQPLVHLVADADRATYTAALPVPGEEGPAFGRTLELTALRKNGDSFPAEFSLAAWRDAQTIALTVVVRDVTERKHAQEALRQREAELRQAQKMEAIGRLAGGIAHDFNNLLMAIRGYSELLLLSLDRGDERRGDAEEIILASERAATLTHQLLAFSRKQVIAPQVVRVDEILMNMEKMLQRLIAEDIHFSTASESSLGSVLADPGQIEQVLVNLVVNARDAMPGGGTLAIEMRNVELDDIGISAHQGLQPGRYIGISVSDTGSGMDADTVARIFEPFFTTKEVGKGTGLGLATVYGIVQQSGGAIEVHSQPGQGTTFYVYLPETTREPAPQRPKHIATTTSGSETVLLVEDDDRVRTLVASMLRKRGYTVLIASQGDQALEIASLHSGPIHLLVTDVVMPGMSGRVLSERLTSVRPHTRVLFMSGYSDDAILRHGVKSAGAHFIQKPFAFDALAQKVREALVSPTNASASA